MKNYIVFCKNIKTNLESVVHTKADNEWEARRKVSQQIRGTHKTTIVGKAK